MEEPKFAWFCFGVFVSLVLAFFYIHPNIFLALLVARNSLDMNIKNYQIEESKTKEVLLLLFT